LSARTAQAYVGLLALDAQREVAQLTVQSRRDALRVAEDRVATGYSSQLELAQARAEFESVSQSIPRLDLAIRMQEHALRQLAGELPGPVERGRRFDDLAAPDVPLSLPAGLLRRRPDLLAAEQRLTALDASLAATRAQFLPQISLSASGGRLYVGALGYDPLTVFDVGGSVLAPLFSAGRLRAQFDAGLARRDQAAFAYRQAALGAFADVENALTGLVRYAEQTGHASARREALRQSVQHAEDRFRAGYASQLELLDAQRNLYAVELELISLRQSDLDARISLYQSLGGGW
jgi:outer membrane protein, multidrug efflux system